MIEVRIDVLGPLQVTVAGRPMRLGGPGCRAVLATLALHNGTVVSLGQLLDAVWDTEPPRTAVTKLQGHVSRLRRELVQLGGPDAANVVQTKHPGYVLCQHRTSTDAAQFDQLLRRAPSTDQAERAAQLAAALDLWRGPACVDVETSAVRSLSTVLDERRMRAVETLAELRLNNAEYDEVFDSLHRLVREAPYRERAWEVLLRAYVRRGDAVTALALYEQVSRLFESELGIAPGSRLRELAASVGRVPLPRVVTTGER